jgi:hypothetical protein
MKRGNFPLSAFATLMAPVGRSHRATVPAIAASISAETEIAYDGCDQQEATRILISFCPRTGRRARPKLAA